MSFKKGIGNIVKMLFKTIVDLILCITVVKVWFYLS